MINKVNLYDSVNALSKLFEYSKIGTLNNHMLNVLQAENRTLDFHVHDNSDELFSALRVSSILNSKTDSPICAVAT